MGSVKFLPIWAELKVRGAQPRNMVKPLNFAVCIIRLFTCSVPVGRGPRLYCEPVLAGKLNRILNPRSGQGVPRDGLSDCKERKATGVSLVLAVLRNSRNLSLRLSIG